MISNPFLTWSPEIRHKDRSHHMAWQGIKVKFTAASDYTRGWEKAFDLRTPMKIMQHLITEPGQTRRRSENSNKRKESYHKAYE